MKYCVYLTTYNGDRLPPKYIGSTSKERLDRGYMGSVRSKKWRDIWKEETKSHPELFTVSVLSVHATREDALSEELRLQRLHDVVRSPEWINEALAQPRGYFGRDTSNENNPNFGKGEKVREWCRQHPDLASERSRKAATTQWADPHTRKSKVEGMRGKTKSRKNLTEEQFKQLQRTKSLKSALMNSIKIEYNGKVYCGWQTLLDETGVTKHLYRKYYINGIDPLLRKGASGPKPNI